MPAGDGTFQYNLDLEEGIGAGDRLPSTSHGITIAVKRFSEPHLAGTIIDYRTTEAGEGFWFENPNAASALLENVPSRRSTARSLSRRRKPVNCFLGPTPRWRSLPHLNAPEVLMRSASVHCSCRAAVAVAAMLMSIGSAHVPAAQPPSQEGVRPGGGATTRHDFVADELAFNQRTLAGDYQRIGKRNAAWDGAVEAFLDGMARNFTRSGEQAYYLIEAPEKTQLLAEAERIVNDLKCDDPLVLYCHALLLMDNGGDRGDPWADEAKAVEAYELLRESDYSAFRKASAARRVVNVSAMPSSPWINKPVTQLAEQDAFNYDVACFREVAFTPEEARVMLEYIWEPRLSGTPSAADLKKFADAVADASEHQWAVLMVQGDAARAAAAEARGTGYADTVTEAGWIGFRAGMRDAGRYYARAHKLHPDRPEAATGLISVATVGHGPPETNAQHWFEQAIAAQIDYSQAWTEYRQSLLPRWGGSHEQMVELGRQALATERWDTAVPHRYHYQVWSVAWDTQGDWQRVRDFGPTIWHDFKRMYAGIIPPLNQRGAWNANRLAAERLAIAWVLHEWEDAAALLAPGGEEAGITSSPYHATEFSDVGGLPRRAVAEIAARTGDHRDAIERAESFEKLNDPDAADAAWSEALAAMAEEAPGRYFVECRLREREFARRLQDAPAGEWIDVPLDLAYWEAVEGDWRVEDDKLVATATLDYRSGDARYSTQVGNPTIVFLPLMPGAYDVRATIGRTSNASDEPCLSTLVGIHPSWGALNVGKALINLPAKLLVMQNPSGRWSSGRLSNRQPQPVLQFNVGSDGAVAMYLDDQVRMERGSNYAPPGGIPKRIAITSYRAHLDDVLTVHNIQVRRTE